ncbi:aldehyde dehydrogenase (NAD+) [Algoriphagus ratkowskyi]|uniref:Aldehyde dehydrogenase n=1 Tax=Algoriphagus ratkowskyi TaxID=57028 RepID=A0A2W7R224_9BACT|nr:aldehyde dehydrogenase family protein [Algoriphagus ratkowskyi]PZX54594.1 aldehyde dehydrogenase (NAD+) [Algoriphagus ratkowskyi]TXD76909.1 aldehyde dehydrogenase family protein [Algoriphagus ratkowskyi]
MILSPSSSINPNLQLIFQSQVETSYQWRISTLDERVARLKKVRAWIKDYQQDIRDALANDFSKPEPETDLTEIFPVTAEINHTIKHLKKWMQPKSVSTPLPMLGTTSKIYKEPKGTSLIISPWNYPFNLTIGPLISALAAGCTAIIKPSEMTPHTSELIARMISELFNSNEVSVILGEVAVSQALLQLPFDHIFFTGSPAVGKIVMKAAAEHLTSVTLELGGKSPVIVNEDADLKDAAEKLIWGKYVNCGQTCIAPDYVLVHKSQEEMFLSEMKVALQKMYDPDFKGIDQSPDMARIVNDKNFQRLKGYIDDAVAKGAKIAFGGKLDPQSRYIEPTILTDVTDEMLVLQEEIFGPIFPIVPYSTLEQAIAYVNSKPKPLALYYFGNDSEHASKVLGETSSGNAVINDCVIHYLHMELPFGGVNNSGIGKAHGYHGFMAFSNEKGVLKQRVGLNNVTLLRPPYGIRAKQIIESLIKWF